MIAFKGRLGWIQYMPKKPIKWGIKVFALCESSTGYTVRMKVYTGKEEDLQAPPGAQAPQGAQAGQPDPTTQHPGKDFVYASGKVVLDLIDGLQNQGYKIYCDNFYTSPALFKALKEKGFEACGTCKPTAAGLPKEANPKENKMKKGDPIRYFEKDGLILSAWHDNKQVTVLSTMHDATESQKQLRSRHDPTGHRLVTKPVMVTDYNANMGGVDKADQYYQYYKHPHRSGKWWKRILFHLLDVCITNAYVVYKEAHPDTKKDTLDFRLDIIDGLLKDWPMNQSRRGRRSSRERPDRLTGQLHIPGRAQGRPDCVVCSDRSRDHGRRQTNTNCVQCDVALCAVPCFGVYHTQLNYRR